MILQLLGIIVIFMATFFVFKTARENGRQAALWALATFAFGVGTQIFLPVLVGIVIGLYLVLTGTRPESVAEAFSGWDTVLVLVSLVLSVVGMFMILRWVARIPEEPEVSLDVPPPPRFDG